MLYLLCDRTDWFKLLPKGARWAEIGVFKGDNASKILDCCAPSELHLIDPWRFDLDFDWFNPPSWSPRFGDAARYVKQLSAWAEIPAGQHVNDYFDGLHAGVAKRFANDKRVKIHRTTSREASAGFADRYFDFVYVDGAHDYESVLADLHAYDPKLKEDGVLLGDDYCEHGPDENAQYGVIAAINKFLKRTGPRLLLVNKDPHSFYALLKPELPGGAALLKRMIDSRIFLIELNDSLAANYHQKKITCSDGSIRYLPSF